MGHFAGCSAVAATLLLNLSSDEGVPRFSHRQIESLNTLMEEQIWDGRPIPCQDKGQRVKIVFLVDEPTSLTQIASGALASRISLREDIKASTFEAAPDPVIHAAVSHSADEALVIDLQDDSASWQSTLFGGPELTLAQTWQHGPGALEGFDFSRQLLVLRNPPADPRLMDQVLAWLAKHPESVRLEHGLPGDEAAQRLARKQPAADFERILHTRPDTICTLSQGNIDEVLHGGYGARNDTLARLPSTLSQAQANAGTQRPVILVTEPLTPQVWDRLMQHTEHFAVAVAPGVQVDERYGAHVATASRMAPLAAPSIDDLRQASTWPAPVTILHSADPTLVDPSLPEDCTRIHLTPATRSDELLYSLKRQAPQEGPELPGLQVQTHRLVEDLQAGKFVALYGLETNPSLVRDLAPLLHPPHILAINGERIAVNGRLIVVSPDRQLIERHGLTPAMQDPAPTGQAWRQAVTNRLVADLVSARQAEKLLAPVVEWFDTLQRAGVMPHQDPPVRYATVHTLCRTLTKLRASGRSPDPEEARLVRSLLKDMLIGDYRRPDQVHDTRYAQLKACLKVLLAGEMSEMPKQSVDLSRLKDLLAQVRHPRDIETLAWPFLNAFSPDVIERVIGTPVSSAVVPSAQSGIAAKVLDLVCAQARAHRVELPPLVAKEPSARSRVKVMRSYARPTPLGRDRKLMGKVEQAQAQGIFLKGPPGTGKTHLVESLSQGRPLFWASIVHEGTTAFGERLQAWAVSQPPGTLVVDEANLARPGNLAMLKGVFADRSLHLNGVVHKLEADHRIIFTGNADSLPGRSPQQVAQESFATVQFKSMHTDFLRKAFVEPVIESSLRLGLGPEVARIGDQILQIHERLQKVFPGTGLSPRDLEECLARALTQRQARGPQDLAPMLASVALQVYGASLPKESLPMVQAWLRHQLRVPAGAGLPELFDAQAIGHALQEQQLAPTKSTLALAGAVDGWLRSQGARETFNPKNGTLGKGALLIEGPASRGKDAVVKAMLQAQGKREGIAFVHLNANPNDLDGLRAAVTSARERGQVLLVSELNLLPSGILEGEFNTLLTGQTGQPAAPGFALIATVNAGYAGRESFSTALRNRMQLLTLQDYAPEEILPIARAHAQKLGAQASSAGSSGTAAAPAVADDKLQELVDRHIDLLGKLHGQPSEFRPGIRQLRDALALLARGPMMTVEEAFAGQYGFYRRLAAQGPVVPVASENAPEEQLARQLRTALGLAYPGVCQPALRADPMLSVALPLDYDARQHQLRFRPDGEPEELTTYMLEEARRGRLFAGEAVADDGSVDAGTVGRLPGSFNPSTGFRSGVGSPLEEGDAIGHITNAGRGDGYLVTSRATADGREWALAVRHEGNHPVANQAPRIALKETLISLVGSERRVYFPVPLNRRPAAVRLGDHQPGAVHRDERGGWYVLAQGQGQIVRSVTYSLVDDINADSEADNRLPDLPPEFRDLEGAFKPTLAEQIRLLSAQRVETQMSDVVVANKLAAIFRTTLQYSGDDAKALNDTSSVGQRCKRFLSVGQGVCYEFAHSYAAVLMQSFGIAARVCHGRVAPSGKGISNVPHAWAEVRDGEEGHWHSVETTSPDRSWAGPMGESQAARESLAPGEAGAVRNRIGEPSGEESSYQKRIPPLSGKNLFDETFEPELLEGISLDALGLASSKLQRGAAQYHPTTGVLDLKQLIAGEPDMFRRAALSEAIEARTLVIEDLPPSTGNDEDWKRFWFMMSKPLAALMRKGVPVLIRNDRGTLQPAAFYNDIKKRCEERASGAVSPSDDLPDGSAVIGRHSNELLGKISSQYFESLLRVHFVDPQRDDDIKLCVLYHLCAHLDHGFKLGPADLPIEFTVHGRHMQISAKDFQKFRRLAKWEIQRLTQQHSTGKFSTDVAGGGDAARDIGDSLLRIWWVALNR